MFTLKKDIDRQVDLFYLNVSRRSLYQANMQREWVKKFVSVNHIEDIFIDEIEGKVNKFREWLFENYSSQFHRDQAIGSVHRFLKFFRCISWRSVI